MPDLINMDIYEAENLLRKEAFDVKIVGKSKKVLKQVPLAGARILEGTTVLLFTEEDYDRNYLIAVPDLTGMTVDEASYLLEQIGLLLQVKGKGRIIKQDIQAGERVSIGTVISVEAKDSA